MNRLSRLFLLIPSFLILSDVAHAQTFVYECHAQDSSTLAVEVIFPRYSPEKVTVGNDLSITTEWPLDRATVTEVDGVSFSCYETKSAAVFPKETENYCLSQEFYNGLARAHLFYRRKVRENAFHSERFEKTYECKTGEQR